ncbi:SO2930 family diheme c-type cytochrome [Phenylobacterium sp.]|uniref:SO2930 family diheme c-type cytochrome n=1 Tax=Phenylobacterium sp. TaxID=1871053 RepID=UPI002811FF50|nr:SO2930 family diheme c-type cytochrome [Phenylobacterium sp.]
MAPRLAKLAAGLAALLCLGGAPAGPDFARLLDETPAPRLSDYRLPLTDGGRAAGAGLTPYALNTPLFSDYAEKFRFVGLPPGKRAAYRAEGAFDFPVGTVLVKTFAYPADLRRPTENVRSLETRLLIRQADGWKALAYVWNAEQTEAVLKRAGARMNVEVTDVQGRSKTIDYAVPNQNQCKECHQLDKALVPLGPKARNLNGDFAYASGRENQLAQWTKSGLLTGAPQPATAPRIARWDEPAEPVAARARAYLDANCAHCHHPQAIASNSGLFLQWEETNPVALGVGKRPVAAGRGSGGLEVAIAPGRPEASILVHRMASEEPGVMMPELGRSVTHAEGLALIRQWIAEMR